MAPPSQLPPATCLPDHSLVHSLPLLRPWVECPPSSAATQCRRRRPHRRPGRTQGLTVGHLPWPAAPLGPDLFLGWSSHLAKLGAQHLGLGRVWPCQVGPQLLDVAETEACSGCGAAVLGGVVHRLQLGGQEKAWVGAAPGIGPSTLELGAYSLCQHQQLPEASIWPGPSAPVAKASRQVGTGRGCWPGPGSGCPCGRKLVKAGPAESLS